MLNTFNYDFLLYSIIIKRSFIKKKNSFHRVDENISSQYVTLIDSDGKNKGKMLTSNALALAKDQGMNLVEMSAGLETPVCKVMSYSKHVYKAKKKASDIRKKSKKTDVKEVKIRPNISQNDYLVKFKSIERFVGSGNKAKITLRMRGREVIHRNLAKNLLDKIIEDSKEFAEIESLSDKEKYQMILVLTPIKN